MSNPGLLQLLGVLCTLYFRGTECRPRLALTVPGHPGDDSGTVRACPGSTLRLRVALVHDGNDTVDGSSDLSHAYAFRPASGSLAAVIASAAAHNASADGESVVVSGDYAGRLELTEDFGVSIRDVTPEDSGLYSINVTLVDGNVTTLYADVNVVISDEAMRGDELRVSVGAGPELVAATGEWHVVLTCHTPPNVSHEDIVWSTPRGLLSSTHYADGQHRLAIANPVRAGDYRCMLGPEPTCESCVDGSRIQGSVTVDAVEARMLLLETENRRLRAHAQAKAKSAGDALRKIKMQIASQALEQTALDATLAAIESRHRDLSNGSALTWAVQDKLAAALKQLTKDVAAARAALEAETARQDLEHEEAMDALEDLESQNAMLSEQVESEEALQEEDSRDLHDLKRQHQALQTAVTESESKRAGFLTRKLRMTSPPANTRLIFSDVIHNAGGGYDVKTGVFTAPIAGDYVFLASFWRRGHTDQWFEVSLVVDSAVKVAVAGDWDRHGDDAPAALQAAVPLRKGQRVWLQADSKNTKFGDDALANTFSGVLVRAEAPKALKSSSALEFQPATQTTMSPAVLAAMMNPMCYLHPMSSAACIALNMHRHLAAAQRG